MRVSDNEVLQLATTVMRYWMEEKTILDTHIKRCRYCHSRPNDAKHKDYCPTNIASRIIKQSGEWNNTKLNID